VTKLVLCRHADPVRPEQAAALARALGATQLAAVYTSPLERAGATASLVAEEHHLVPIVVDDLREIDFGEVEGLGFDDFPPELQDTLLREPTRVRFPGGEGYAELRRRVGEAMDAIVAAHADETAAVVTHAGVIRAALALWLQIPDEAVFRIGQRHASVNVVEWIDGVPVARLVNGSPESAPLA
jgi:broad specificity phosphatase PhoE